MSWEIEIAKDGFFLWDFTTIFNWITQWDFFMENICDFELVVYWCVLDKVVGVVPFNDE